MNPSSTFAPTRAEDRRSALFAERDRLSAERSKLSPALSVHAEAEGRLKALDAREAALNESEASAWVQWTALPDGPPPSPMREDREAIASVCWPPMISPPP
jgi:hypothetical protein